MSLVSNSIAYEMYSTEHFDHFVFYSLLTFNQMEMKSYTAIFVCVFLYATIGFAQNQYYAGMPIRPNCACLNGSIFKVNQRDISFMPYATSVRCKHIIPATFVPTYAHEGFYFLKRKKKKPQPSYPKTSTIIRF